MPYTTTIASNDPYVIMKVADWILVNIFLPYVGTNDGRSIGFNTSNEIISWCEQFNNVSLPFGDEFNSHISSKSNCSVTINDCPCHIDVMSLSELM